MRIRRHFRLLAPASVPPVVDLPTWEKNRSASSPSPHKETAFRSQSRPEHNQGSCGTVVKKKLGEESHPESIDLKGSSVGKTTTEEEEERGGIECKSFPTKEIGFRGAESLEAKQEEENYGERIIDCRRKNTKGWKCKREAKGGKSLCDHHLEQRRAYYHVPRQKPDRTPGILDRSFVLLPPSPSSDFYYYAGFGLLGMEPD